MRIVIDTNILFSYFRKGSFVNRAVKSGLFNFFSPELATEELEKHSKLICAKSGLTKNEFRKALIELKKDVAFISFSEYLPFLSKAILLTNMLNKKDTEEFLDDIDLFSLCLKLKAPIWSNDGIFKKVSEIESFTTAELVDILKSNFGETIK